MPRKRNDPTNVRPALPPANVDHVLMIKEKREGAKSVKIGVGFNNEWGGINVVLNTGVVLSWRDTRDHWLTLWPNDRNEEIPF